MYFIRGFSCLPEVQPLSFRAANVSFYSHFAHFRIWKTVIYIIVKVAQKNTLLWQALTERCSWPLLLCQSILFPASVLISPHRLSRCYRLTASGGEALQQKKDSTRPYNINILHDTIFPLSYKICCSHKGIFCLLKLTSGSPPWVDLLFLMPPPSVPACHAS